MLLTGRSSEPGNILPTAHVARGSVGLGFMSLAVLVFPALFHRKPVTFNL